jgi:hypothetical protein
MSLRRSRATTEGQDQGMAMVFCMVFIIIGMMIVAPILGYAASVLHTSRIQTEKTARSEAVRGALRVAMADPKALYDTCKEPNSGLTKAVTLANPGISIPVVTKCTWVAGAQELNNNDLRTAMTLTRVGSVGPVGSVGSTFAGNGGPDPTAWFTGATVDSTGNKVWAPRLPAHALNHPANAGYMMPVWAGNCRVFFPGTYNSSVTISDATPTFFASGVYYFESSVTFTGSANVVIGEGASEGCTDNQDAAYNAINAPTNHNISGLGATFVLGAAGRLIVNDTGSTGTGPSVVFNTRLVDPTDVGSAASKNVSIISVNGTYVGPGVGADLVLPGLQVPKSLVAADTPADAVSTGYLPSTLVPALEPPTETPIIDINLSTASTAKLFVPGYVAVPQGRISVAVAPGAGAGKEVQLVGGVLAAMFTQTVDVPAINNLGMINRVVQQTFKLTSTTTTGKPKVTSVAIVQINDYGEFAVNSWVTESAGSAP